MMQQTITPNPNIPCKPGWCLAYVNEAFGVTKRFGTATAAWNGSTTQHRNWDFPAGVWLPVWFSLAGEPAGHVALRAPDGSVYSTTDLSTKPRHHPDLADLMRIYAGADMALTYRGWTEDVEGTPVVTSTGITPQGTTITPIQEDDMATVPQDEWDAVRDAAYRINGVITDPHAKVLTTNDIAGIVTTILDSPIARGGAGAGIGDGLTSLRSMVSWNDDGTIQLLAATAASAAQDGGSVEDIKTAVIDALRENVVKVDVTVKGGNQ